MAVANSTCKVDDCSKIVGPKSARGLCRPHYRNLLKYGDSSGAPERECAICVSSFRPVTSGQLACSGCRDEQNRRTTAAYRAANRDKLIEYNRAWRQKNPTYHSEFNKRWRAENREAYLAYHAKYRAENPEVVRERYRQWEARNPKHAVEWVANNRERARENVRRRRSRLRGATTFEIRSRDILRLLDRHRWECVYCGESLRAGYHIDHVVPISRGGSNGVGNILPACDFCNVSKNSWFLSEWRYRSLRSRPLTRPTVL